MKLSIASSRESTVVRVSYQLNDEHGNLRYTYVVLMDEDGDIVDEELFNEMGESVECEGDVQHQIYDLVENS